MDNDEKRDDLDRRDPPARGRRERVAETVWDGITEAEVWAAMEAAFPINSQRSN